MPYLMVYYLSNTTLLQSAGVLLVERSGTQSGGKTGVVGFLKDLFGKPPILSVIFAILMLILGLDLPGPISRFASYISGSVSPLALIYCGFVVYELGLKELRFLPGLPSMLVIRLVLAPVICWLCCRAFGIGGLPESVFIVESALPVVSQVPVLAGNFGADEQYAATGSCLSILGSFISIPVLMLILG